MGTWGLRISENDMYQEVKEAFISSFNEGTDPLLIADVLMEQYKKDIPEWHLAYLSLAKCLWHCNIKYGPIDDVLEMIRVQKVDEEYLVQCGADEKMQNERKRLMDAFYENLRLPASQKEVWSRCLDANSKIKKGDIFWYKIKGDVFGAIVLDIQGDMYYFIALSEKLDRIPTTISEILRAPFFTASWFFDDSLLSGKRIHTIGSVQITDDFNRRAGFLRIENVNTEVYNCGQKEVWAHHSRYLKINNTTMQDSLSKSFYPLFRDK